jgi:cytochrome c oxidase assembly protein subunit 15
MRFPMTPRGSDLLTVAFGTTVAMWTVGYVGRLPFVQAPPPVLLLLGVGGLVTSTNAGLAVVDWPNSFGYGMFLYPLSRMTGGIYFEHAHRLFGSLVGLTTAALAFQVARVEPRRGVRGLALAALALVIVQGILGGLRVTGRFTLSDSPEHMSPQIALAVVHGVTGQVFFALMVVLATVLRPGFRDAGSSRRRVRPSEVTVGAALVGLLLVQIALGAFQRHLATGVLLHLALAGLIAPMAVWHGTRSFGLHGDDPVLPRLGLALAFLTTVQVMLGLAAYVASGAAGVALVSPFWDVALTTAHQWVGALLLGSAVCLLTWARRLRADARERAPELAAQTR